MKRPKPGRPFTSELAARLMALPKAERHERLREIIHPLPRGERFELLHRLGVYHHAETVSGAASTLPETASLRAALPAIVDEERVGTLLDLPCGDFHWMQHVDLRAHYTGADLVPEIVSANRRLYGGAKRRFVVLDAVTDPLPKADLILCRDLLVHLSLCDIAAVLRNFVASGSRLLLTSHFGSRIDNPDIETGDFRPVNLCRAPFGLPSPRRVVDERSQLGSGAFRDRAMGLWDLPELVEVLTAERPTR